MSAKYNDTGRERVKSVSVLFSRYSRWIAVLIIAFSPVVLAVSPPVSFADTLGAVSIYHTGSVHPYGIVQGLDGNLWYTMETDERIGKMTVSGVKTEYWLPSSASMPDHIALDPNGNPWFTMSAAKVGETDYSGNITIHNLTLGSDNGATDGLATGSDGNLWIAREVNLSEAQARHGHRN